jgi:hypothetical protein
MTHTEIQELLGVFALDALEDDEAEAVRRHLEDCPRCRTEVAEHREVAAFLAYAGAPAPPQLWDRIAASLEEPPPALELQPVRRRGSRKFPHFVSLRAAAVGLSVAAASIIGLGVAVVRLDQRHPGSSLAATIRHAMIQPDAVKVPLTSKTGAASAEAVVLPDGQGYLTDAHLSPLTPGHVYQLWGQVQGQLISLGTLGSDPKEAAFTTAPKVTLLAITAENAPGVTVSHQTPVVAGPVTT